MCCENKISVFPLVIIKVSAKLRICGHQKLPCVLQFLILVIYLLSTQMLEKIGCTRIQGKYPSLVFSLSHPLRNPSCFSCPRIVALWPAGGITTSWLSWWRGWLILQKFHFLVSYRLRWNGNKVCSPFLLSHSGLVHDLSPQRWAASTSNWFGFLEFHLLDAKEDFSLWFWPGVGEDKYVIVRSHLLSAYCVLSTLLGSPHLTLEIREVLFW